MLRRHAGDVDSASSNELVVKTKHLLPALASVLLHYIELSSQPRWLDGVHICVALE